MPCYTVRTVSVEFHVEHVDLLQAALKSLDWDFRLAGREVIVTPGRGESPIRLKLGAGLAEMRPEQQSRLNDLKVAYSKQVAKRFAAVNGWEIDWDNTARTAGEFVKEVV